MRVLHAFVSQEHYNNWSSVNAQSVDVFIREFGTPLIAYDSIDMNMEGFVRIIEGSYIRINYNYYNDLVKWSNPSTDLSSPMTQSLLTSEVYGNVESICWTISTQINSFLDRFRTTSIRN